MFLEVEKDDVAISGDMAKMFNQIILTERDRCYHRFLWRFEDLQSESLVFQWLRVLFGDKPSPDLAGFSIRLPADIHKDYCPIGAKVPKNETYIDDVGHSTADSTTANRIIGEVDQILEGGKFSIKVWNLDSPGVDRNPEKKTVDVLGHRWNKESDAISMRLKELTLDMEDGLTKRTALSLVSRLWNPFGYLLLVTIKYSIDLLRIWQDRYGWNQTLPIDLIEEWGQNMKEIQTFKEISTDKCLKPEGVTGPPQLHAFSDSGEDAFGSCVFIRWPTVCGIEIRLIAAKAFVAPLKRKTTPGIELMGAVTMSRLVDEIVEALEYQFEVKRFWVDNEVVIYWLLSQSNRYRSFISSRIQEFQDTHPNVSVRGTDMVCSK